MAYSSAPAPRATTNRSTTPQSDAFARYISSQWADHSETTPEPRAQSSYAAQRRAKLSSMHPGKRIIVPAGAAKVRSNDTDYTYRAHSTFAWLTGWGSDAVPG